jgi:serine/threonine-protein kinase
VASIAELQTEARRRVVARAMRIGLWAWPSFILLDAWMCFVAYPGAPFGLFVVYRIVVALVLFAVYRATRWRGVPILRLVIAQNVAYALAAAAIALMAVHLGGVRSPYMHGISIVALVRAAVIPESRRRAWPTFAAIGLVFPAVMGVGAALSPDARAAWLTSDSLTVFATNYVFVLASAFLGLLSGDIVWRAQEQLYRARRVGRYRLQAPIGKGGMGEVWLAWDLSLRRTVALKLLRGDTATGTDAVQRFEREALAASGLQSPHVVRIFDYGASDDGLYYIAMEYLRGMDLEALVEQHGPVPPARATRFIIQACLALEEAHAAGLIHRDIKPHNLFVTELDGDPDFVKLLDFGVVRFRAATPGDHRLTFTGALIGTPVYLAPELWQGAAADERSDIYALGVTLYFLLTGRVSLRDEWPADAPPVAPALEALVRRCMAVRPDDRVPSARDLRLALAELHDPAAWTRADAAAFWRAAGSTAGPAVSGPVAAG